MDLAQDFGWTFTVIGDLTLGDVDFISVGRRSRPPLAAMVAAFLGVKPSDAPSEAERRDWTPDDIAAFVGAANGRG